MDIQGKNQKKYIGGLKAPLLACLLFTAAGLQADTINWTFDTGAEACPAGGSSTCNGEAVFSYTPGAQSFTITLNNLLTDLNNAGQLVTDVQFTTSLPGISLAGSSGTPVSFNGSAAPTVGSAIPTGWNAGNISTNTWLLCVICTDGVTASATPSEGIIPVESTYNVNGSIEQSNSHNPFLESGATFTFSTSSDLPLNVSTNPFSDVFISFGTTFAEVPAGVDPSTPEPLTPLLAGAGLIMLALTARRRKKNKA